MLIERDNGLYMTVSMILLVITFFTVVALAIAALLGAWWLVIWLWQILV